MWLFFAKISGIASLIFVDVDVLQNQLYGRDHLVGTYYIMSFHLFAKTSFDLCWKRRRR